MDTFTGKNEFWEPVFGAIEVSSLCNYKCIMCPFPGNKFEKFSFTINELLEILDDISSFKSNKLDLTILGGEPLIWKDLEDFIKKIDKRKINPILNTNGSLLTVERVKKLQDAGLKIFILSLESLDPEIHDYYTGKPGSFGQVMKAIDIIDKVYKGSQIITLLPVIMDRNYSDMHKMIKWIAGNPKIKYFSMQALLPNKPVTECIDKDPGYKGIWPKSITRVVSELQRIMVIKKISYPTIIKNPDSQIMAFIEYYKNPSGNHLKDNINFCTYFSIKADGSLILSGQCIGNLKQKGFKELWKSEEGIRARENVCNGKVDLKWYICTQHAYPEDQGYSKKKFRLNDYDSNPASVASLQKTDDIPSLKLAMVKLTNSCNFRCRICNVWKDPDKSFLSLKTGIKIIDQIKEFKEKEICIHFIGGETLLYPDLTNLIKYASKNKIESMITTNGSLLSKKMISSLSDAGLKHLNISLESADRETHDFIRGKKGSHKKIIESISLLGTFAQNINVSINTVITQRNLFDLVSLSRYVLNEKQLRHIYFIAFDKPFNSGYGKTWRDDSPAAFLWPKNIDRIKEAFDLLLEEKRKNPKIGNSLDQLAAYKEYYMHPDSFIKKKGCKFGNNNIQADPSGNVMFCSKNFLPIGNIGKENLKNLFYSEKADSLRKKMNSCTDNCVQILSCSFETEIN